MIMNDAKPSIINDDIDDRWISVYSNKSKK